MAKEITSEHEAHAQELRDAFTDRFDVPDGWSELRESMPLVEAYVESEMPDDYLPQFQIAGYESDDGHTIRVWWLRQGERLQVSYDTAGTDSVTFGGVGRIPAVVAEIEEEL